MDPGEQVRPDRMLFVGENNLLIIGCVFRLPDQYALQLYHRYKRVFFDLIFRLPCFQYRAIIPRVDFTRIKTVGLSGYQMIEF